MPHLLFPENPQRCLSAVHGCEEDGHTGCQLTRKVWNCLAEASAAPAAKQRRVPALPHQPHGKEIRRKEKAGRPFPQREQPRAWKGRQGMVSLPFPSLPVTVDENTSAGSQGTAPLILQVGSERRGGSPDALLLKAHPGRQPLKPQP